MKWIFIIFIIYFIKYIQSSFHNDSNYNIHKVRHLRSLFLRKSKTLIDINRQYNKDCRVQPWGYSDGNSKSGCPSKRCITNQDCVREYGDVQLCTCDLHLCGLVCIDPDARCPFPHNPINGKVIMKDLKVGDVVEYTCRPGYAVKGARKRYCQANLKLSGPEPVCTDQTDYCFSPPYISNSEVVNGRVQNDYRNKESVKIMCQKGFEDIRNSFTIATCEGNEWRYIPLSCQRISCGKLADPINGRAMYTDEYLYQSSAIPFCNDGFKLHCPVPTSIDDKPCKRICQANGTWSGQPATCRPILCPDLRAPDNGFMIGQSSNVNNIRRFRCKEGYKLTGSYVRTCQLNGQWDGWMARCIIRNCGRPPTIPFSRVKFDSTTYGSVAHYSCERGTTLFGPSPQLTCKEKNNSSEWLPQPAPQCVLHCKPLMINNAQIVIDNNVTYRDVDLELEIPHNAQVTVLCTRGYEPSQRVKPQCQNGTWTHIPHCVEASCPKRPDAEANSLVRFYSLKHNAIARYYCHYGYRVWHNTTMGRPVYRDYYNIQCIRGRWIKPPVKGCLPTKCNTPQPPENGQVVLIGQGDNIQLTNNIIQVNHGRVLKFTCLPDYRLIGSKIIVCLNGAWSPPDVPKCEFIMHDKLPLSWLFYDPPLNN